jgi:hypothetical protein
MGRSVEVSVNWTARGSSPVVWFALNDAVNGETVILVVFQQEP